eukprot:760001-Hanusia_phi.AAC.2
MQDVVSIVNASMKSFYGLARCCDLSEVDPEVPVGFLPRSLMPFRCSAAFSADEMPLSPELAEGPTANSSLATILSTRESR